MNGDSTVNRFTISVCLMANVLWQMKDAILRLPVLPGSADALGDVEKINKLSVAYFLCDC